MEQTMSPSPDTLVAAPAPPSDLDKMFTGLGIDPFSFNQPPSKEKEPPALPVVSNNGRLTIEDKRRIAQQQENVRKFSNQQQPKALPPPRNTALTHKPVDLAATLLQSNLNQLSKPIPSSASHPAPPSQGMTQLTNTHFSTTGMTNSNFGFQNQFNAFDNQPALPTNWNAPSSGNFNNKWANNQNQAQAKKQDWSAFESLLPTPNNNTPSNSNTKKLSDNEMMDLLS